jgi:membrane protein YqaA with SNARE-associated domain
METSIPIRHEKEGDSRECLMASKMSQKLRKSVLTMLLVMSTFAVCAAAIYYREYFEYFQYLGYPSAFVFGFIAGSSLPMPLPYLIVTFSLGGVLNPTLVGLASGVGAGIGGALVYLFGSNGSWLLPGINIFKAHTNPEESTKAEKLYARLQQWTHRRGSLVVFLMSSIFNPVFAPMAVAIGAFRFGFWRFFSGAPWETWSRACLLPTVAISAWELYYDG